MSEAATQGAGSGVGPAFEPAAGLLPGSPQQDPQTPQVSLLLGRAASDSLRAASKQPVTRRHLNSLLLFLPLTLARAAARTSIAGRLQPAAGGDISIQTTEGRLVRLDGDISTKAVLRDPRIVREAFEAHGEWKSKDLFQIDPIHLKALFIRRAGKLFVITYWCEVCAIRTYAPGRCACCQEETAFDPRDPSLENTAPQLAK